MNNEKSKLELIGEIAQANNKNLELIEELNNKENEIERLHNIIEEVKKVLNDKRSIMTMKLLDGSYCDYEELLYQVDEEIRKILDKGE